MWGFNLKKKIDPITGLEIEIPTSVSNSLLIIKPDPYQMAFEPRSAARKAEITENWKKAEDDDNQKRATFAKTAGHAGDPVLI